MCIKYNCDGNETFIMDVEEDDGLIYELWECDICGHQWLEDTVPESPGSLADEQPQN